MSKSTIKSCLTEIGVDASLLKTLGRLDDEFSLIKKTYFKKIIIVHPDKGGDAQEFRRVNEAFEALREIYEKKSISSFVASLERKADKIKTQERSWDYYNDAFDVSMPIYKVELAKSSRSKCTQKTKSAKKCTIEEIDKGDVRVGSIDLDSGTYTRWVHLMCWRVPSRIWQGLPNPDICQDKSMFESSLSSMNEVLFTGFDLLSAIDKERIIDHVMDKTHWAKLRHRPGPPLLQGADQEKPSQGILENVKQEGDNVIKEENVIKGENVEKGGNAQLVRVKNDSQFSMPIVTSKNKDFLQGKTVVLTGIFPEVGGGAGLSLGKEKVKQMVASFGGRVTSSISGKTDLLIVGSEPGFSKVSKARSQSKCQLLSLEGLSTAIENGNSEALENAPPLLIGDFSSGYRGTSTLALEASSHELEIARGLKEPPKQIENPKKSLLEKQESALTKKKPKAPSTKAPKVAKSEKTSKEISGLDEEDALALLRSNDWNLQVAINEFLTNPQGVRKRKSTRETPKSTDVSSASNDVSSSVSREETSRETGGQSPQGNSRENSGLFGLIATGINTLMRMLKWALTFVFGKDHVKAISGSTSANEFKRFFESEYGTVHPPFFIGSYSQLLEKGKRESNWILIAFYAPDHPGNTDFFKDIIASSQLKGFLSRKKGLFWVGDLRTEEGIKVSRVLSVSQHPFLAIIAPQNSKMMIFDRIQGEFSIEETMYKLTQGISKLESLLEGVRNERASRAADRSIREQQDEAYLASLKADQEKERLARIEREQKENEEKEANQREQLRLDKLEEKKRRKEYLRNNLPQEPKDAEDISKLSIRLPSGQRLVRVFRATSLVREVYEFAEAQDLSPLPLESDFVLVKPFPRVILEDLDISLNSCGLTNASLIVEEKL